MAKPRPPSRRVTAEQDAILAAAAELREWRQDPVAVLKAAARVAYGYLVDPSPVTVLERAYRRSPFAKYQREHREKKPKQRPGRKPKPALPQEVYVADRYRTLRRQGADRQTAVRQACSEARFTPGLGAAAQWNRVRAILDRERRARTRNATPPAP